MIINAFNRLPDTLDWKLKSVVSKIAHGDLGARMFAREEEMKAAGLKYRGRQMLKDVIRWHSGEDAEALMHDLEDLQKVTLNGLALRKFLNMWNFIWTGMKHHPDAISKRCIFFAQVQKFTPLSAEWDRFKRRSERSKKKTFEWLEKKCRVYLAHRKREMDIAARRKNLFNADGTTPTIRSAAPPASGGSQDLRAWRPS